MKITPEQLQMLEELLEKTPVEVSGSHNSYERSIRTYTDQGNDAHYHLFTLRCYHGRESLAITQCEHDCSYAIQALEGAEMNDLLRTLLKWRFDQMEWYVEQAKLEYVADDQPF